MEIYLHFGRMGDIWEWVWVFVHIGQARNVGGVGARGFGLGPVASADLGIASTDWKDWTTDVAKPGHRLKDWGNRRARREGLECGRFGAARLGKVPLPPTCGADRPPVGAVHP